MKIYGNISLEVKKLTVCGIICEYNPFHKGHKYHIEKAREITGAEAIVAIMSGNYVQRGEIAVYNKELRAKAAIENGVDLVIELPAIMSLSSAERFAFSGITILNTLGLVDYICFGAECDDLSKLKEIAQVLSSESEPFKSKLYAKMKGGVSFATARAAALSCDIPEAEEILSSPNNILAIEYLKAISKTNSTITPVLVKREGSDYNSTELNGGFISATAARELIFKGESLSGFVPDNTISIYKSATPHNIEKMSGAIIANICKRNTSEVAEIAGVSEGLENKIKKEAVNSKSFYELCDRVKSKRYAHSRIRRILLNSYLGIKKEDLIPPQYIKILDFNETGRKVLNKAKQEALLPLVKNFKQIRELNNPKAEKMWKNELIFDQIYNLF